MTLRPRVAITAWNTTIYALCILHRSGSEVYCLDINDLSFSSLRSHGEILANGISSIEELEKALIGMDPNNTCEIDPSPYISGMSFGELEELLAQ
jgi:hypothetical protein